MTINPRQTLDRELRNLQDDMLILGSMVEDALLESVDYLKKRDMDGSRRVMARDREINEKRFALEGRALALIARHQPVARDLRILAAVLEITTELERIGDYAKGIGKINLLIGDQPLVKPLIDIPRMVDKATSMLHRALDAFVQQDAAAARALSAEDDDVDALYEQVYRELVTYILADPGCLEQANYLLWAAHNLERTADRVCNICERIIFTVTGELMEFVSNENTHDVA
ncbi:MAG: phosphate signaling complex protein PhoU [Anaerolineae bacterium]|nr:phosphate signaling complex protein PhoU [Anaerolineae bacterium]